MAHYNRDTPQCSAEPHKLGRLGATPGPVIDFRLSLRERIDSLCNFRGAKGNFGRVRKLEKRLGRERQVLCVTGIFRFDSCLDHLAQNDRMVQRLRRLHDTQEIEGSIPSAITVC